MYKAFFLHKTCNRNISISANSSTFLLDVAKKCLFEKTSGNFQSIHLFTGNRHFHLLSNATRRQNVGNQSINYAGEGKIFLRRANYSNNAREDWHKNRTHRKLPRLISDSNKTGLYLIALVIAVLGASYAAVPLYRLYCRTTGYGGTPLVNTDPTDSVVIKDRKITVYFESQTDPNLPWEFEPCQRSISVSPGEKVLAFFSAKNLSDKDLIGFAIYNVLPDQIAAYFNKIQCFCFDEQRLNAHEHVYMPVYFFIDPDVVNDKKLNKLSQVTLSYTFYMAQDQTYEIFEKEIDQHQQRQKQLELKYNL